jgi:small basic protein
MEQLITYISGFVVGIGTIMELVKKMTDLPEIWYKPIAVVASVLGGLVASLFYGFGWDVFIVSSVFLTCAQFGWDFLAIKPLLKKIVWTK